MTARCGCCGHSFAWLWWGFCVRCRTAAAHLGPPDLPAGERTHEATHGQPCPFSDTAVSNP